MEIKAKRFWCTWCKEWTLASRISNLDADKLCPFCGTVLKDKKEKE